jgi:hypothetical protein
MEVAKAVVDTFTLTREFLSGLLGVRRATLYVATGMLKKVRFIEHVRRKITVARAGPRIRRVRPLSSRHKSIRFPSAQDCQVYGLGIRDLVNLCATGQINVIAPVYMILCPCQALNGI